MLRRKHWFTLAVSVASAGFASAQMPAVVVSDPVFRPSPSVIVTPPTPVTTVTTLEASNVLGVTHRSTPTTVPTVPAGSIIVNPTLQPPPANYLLNPYFGYYQTQWRPFPGNTSGPGCEVPPVVRETFTPIGPPITPTTPLLPPVSPAPMVIPPKPMPMLVEPPKPELKEPPKPELKEPPKLEINAPSKPLLDTPLTPPTPPKPLLLDTPAMPSNTLPAGGPRLPVQDITPPLPPVAPVGFAETRRPATPVTGEPKKLATLGLPQTPANAEQLPIIRSAIKTDDTQRPDWPIIRTGTPGK